tara:strand:- start:76 stop:537 length:462 start_codon:yes stop_codon:yes gene_type:complete
MKTWDNVFTQPLLEVIQDQIKYLRYEPHGSGEKDSPNTFLYSGELINNRFWQYLFNKILTNIPIKQTVVSRCYVNKYPPKTFSDWHIDNKDKSCSHTIIFYPDESGANTVFKKQQIEYKQNRLLWFDSKLLHKTNINDTIKHRHTLVYKIKGK